MVIDFAVAAELVFGGSDYQEPKQQRMIDLMLQNMRGVGNYDTENFLTVFYALTDRLKDRHRAARFIAQLADYFTRDVAGYSAAVERLMKCTDEMTDKVEAAELVRPYLNTVTDFPEYDRHKDRMWKYVDQFPSKLLAVKFTFKRIFYSEPFSINDHWVVSLNQNAILYKNSPDYKKYYRDKREDRISIPDLEAGFGRLWRDADLVIEGGKKKEKLEVVNIALHILARLADDEPNLAIAGDKFVSYVTSLEDKQKQRNYLNSALQHLPKDGPATAEARRILIALYEEQEKRKLAADRREARRPKVKPATDEDLNCLAVRLKAAPFISADGPI